MRKNNSKSMCAIQSLSKVIPKHDANKKLDIEMNKRKAKADFIGENVNYQLSICFRYSNH